MEKREVDLWTGVFDATFLVRRRCAEAIINSPDFEEPEWRKKIALSHHPLVEFRSQCINAIVRQDSRGMPDAGPPDERYLRLRAAAQSMVAPIIEELQKLYAEAA